MGLRQLCELCGPLRALRKRNPLKKERYVSAKLAKDRKVRKEAHQPVNAAVLVAYGPF